VLGIPDAHNAEIFNDPAMFRSQWNAALDDAATVDAVDQLPYIKVSILMCAFNEQRTISRAIREVLAVDYPCEIELIVVDDGSTDATASIMAQFSDPRLILHKHEKNKGKGGALRTAASLASGTHLLPFDADLEYQPKDIPRLIEPIMTGRFEVVYGARLFGYNTVYHSFRYAVGNKVLTTLMNVLFDAYLSDMHTCLKLMPVNTFKNLKLRENGFGLDTEITAALLRLGIRPFEVPVSYYSRSHAEGKKINVWDALECLHILFKVRTKRKKGLTLPALEAGGADQIALPAVDGSSTSADLADVDALEAANPVAPEAGAVAGG
jgi:glycosyltransferase involved in cell wall biosynthesis